jgi:Tol biopolymer transport system component
MIGQRICGFDITARLGSGAMGEVYRARDSRLGREVAVKLLPAQFAADPERLARFEREARALAALNHPHIAGIYSVEHRHDDPSASGRVLVLELVEGITLEERLAAPPRPSPEEAVAIARQLAAALDAAHEKGIVHRDLKPANIKIAPDGTVKVLDFGLAMFADSHGVTERSTLTTLGTMLGTPAYMSPEQARGLLVDKRSDIWAFGCILFELLAGVHPFAASTISDTIAAVLDREPDWTRLPPDMPIALSRLLHRCLAKDARARLRDIGDAQLTEEAAAPVRLPARSVQFQRLTASAGLNEHPAISPDGKMVAFVAAVNGSRQIFVVLLAGGVPLQVTRDEGDHERPRWTPDSSAIVYYTPPAAGGAGTVWEVPALGGQPRPIVSASSGADVSHDGTRLAFFRVEGRPQLVTTARDGSDPRVVTSVPAIEHQTIVRWSPDDRLLLLHASIVPNFNEQLLVVDARGGESRIIIRSSSLRGASWLPDGSGLVYSSPVGSTIPYPPTSNLRVVRLDGTGDRQITYGDDSYLDPDVHATGKLVACRVRSDSDIWRIPIGGDPVSNVRDAVRITRQTGQVQTPCMSPDGRSVVYLSDQGGHGNIWICNSDGSNARQLTFERDPDVAIGLPIWSPTGRDIVFVRFPGRTDLWLIAPDGRGARRIVEGGLSATWSPDGRWLYYMPPVEWDIHRIPISGGGQPELVRRGPDVGVMAVTETDLFWAHRVIHEDVSCWEMRRGRLESEDSRVLARIASDRFPVSRSFISGTLSPDERFLALPLQDSGTTNIWLIDAERGGVQPATDFGGEAILISRRVSWTPDSRSIVAAVARRHSDVILLDGLV